MREGTRRSFAPWCAEHSGSRAVCALSIVASGDGSGALRAIRKRCVTHCVAVDRGPCATSIESVPLESRYRPCSLLLLCPTDTYPFSFELVALCPTTTAHWVPPPYVVCIQRRCMGIVARPRAGSRWSSTESNRGASRVRRAGLPRGRYLPTPSAAGSGYASRARGRGPLSLLPAPKAL